MSTLAQTILEIAVVVSTIWMMLAVHYHARQWLVRIAASLLPLLAVAAAFLLLPLVPWAILAWATICAVTGLWWWLRKPQADRDWAVGMERLPRVRIERDQVQITNFRNFNWSNPTSPVIHYEDQVFDLSQLRSLDYFLSHWSGPVVAHTLVSFGFDDGRFLAVSVEARRQRWQRYAPIWGLFRSYELIFVLGDERDIVRLRTEMRRERVYMYRLQLSQLALRELLLGYLARVESLVTRPEWYHSLLSNCTTNLAHYQRRQIGWLSMPGVILNGFSARTLYRLGFLDRTMPFRALKARCELRPDGHPTAEGVGFSQSLRAQADVRSANREVISAK
jgi:hypothetical protein